MIYLCVVKNRLQRTFNAESAPYSITDDATDRTVICEFVLLRDSSIHAQTLTTRSRHLNDTEVPIVELSYYQLRISDVPQSKFH